jgi:tetratricopeptide (TPR) repeat protein
VSGLAPSSQTRYGANSLRALAHAAVCALLMGMAACATNPPPVTPGAPLYPDFVFPAPPPSPRAGAVAAGDARVLAELERAWRLLQAGDTRLAEREFTALADRGPAYFPAEAGLGYANIAQRRFKDGLTRFDRVLALQPGYAPAHAGRGDALLGLSRTDEALAAFEAALAADPSLEEVKRRVEVLRFSGLRNLVAAAKRASESGRTEDARRLYGQAIAASPDSAFLYRDLARVELSGNAPALAVTHLQKATGLDPADLQSWLMLGETLERLEECDAAADAYRRALSIEPSDSTRALMERARGRGDLSRLPPDYQAIPTAAQITRAELAALIGVRFQRRLATARLRVAPVVIDTREHWAAPWIMTVIQVGAMDVFSNHTFQPRTTVRRVDLAQVVSRLLDILGPVSPAPLRRRIADVGPGYMGYAAISAAVASGAIPLLEGDTFQPGRPVGGAEAIGVMDRLEGLLPSARGATGTPDS